MRFFFNSHRSANSLSTGDAVQAGLDLSLDRLEVLIPCQDQLSSRRRWIGKAFLVAKAMKQCIVLGKQCMLGHDLGSEEMGKYRESGLDHRWKTSFEMVVCNLIFLVQVSNGFGSAIYVQIGNSRAKDVCKYWRFEHEHSALRHNVHLLLVSIPSRPSPRTHYLFLTSLFFASRCRPSSGTSQNPAKVVSLVVSGAPRSRTLYLSISSLLDDLFHGLNAILGLLCRPYNPCIDSRNHFQ